MTERQAQEVSWTELRALQKGKEEEDYGAWVRARFVAHTIYLHIPVFSKGARKEKDPRRFFPLPGDRPKDEEAKARRTRVIKVTQKQMDALNALCEKYGIGKK